jgi:hypothetical protein
MLPNGDTIACRANAQSSESRQQLSPEVIVPGGPQEFLIHAPLGGVAFQEIEGDLTDGRRWPPTAWVGGP